MTTESLQTYFASLGERPLVQALLIAALFLMLGKITDWVLTGAIRVWARRTRTTLDDRLLALVHRPVFISVLLFGLWLAITRLPVPELYLRYLLALIKSVAILIWTLFLVRGAKVLIEAASRLESRARFIEPRTVALADNAAKIVIIGGGVYALCLAWDVDIAGWMVSAGVLGLVLGLAAKDTLANLFAGMFILADAPYKVGDFIILDSGERGEVTQIGLRSTRLLTRDDIEVTVPNAVIANAKIINEAGGPWEMERVRVKVGVAYGTDIDEVRALLLGIARGNPEIVTEPEPRVRFRGFGDSSLDLELLGWIARPVLRGRVLDALYTEIYKGFARNGIEIPYPKRDVYLHPAAGADE